MTDLMLLSTSQPPFRSIRGRGRAKVARIQSERAFLKEAKRSEMEGSGLAGDSADSWNEVVAISATMEQMFKEGARSDAARLRAIVERRREIAAEVATRKAAAERQLDRASLLLVSFAAFWLLAACGRLVLMRVADMKANLREWEEKDGAARARGEQLRVRLQELEAKRREMNVELERFKENEESSKKALDKLADQYEEVRLELVQYTVQHQNEVPAAKYVVQHRGGLCGSDMKMAATGTR